MIIFSIKGTCPVCEESVEIYLSHPDTKIEAYREEIFLSFKCSQCGENIDQECLECE